MSISPELSGLPVTPRTLLRLMQDEEALDKLLQSDPNNLDEGLLPSHPSPHSNSPDPNNSAACYDEPEPVPLRPNGSLRTSAKKQRFNCCNGCIIV